MTVCIAGKNRIAVRALEFLLSIGIRRSDILACVNSTDLGVHAWQPSFKKICQKEEIRVVKLEDLYTIGDLVFFSLEFDQLILPGRFVSRQLYNIHFSKLPAYKGMYTSIWPIVNGEKVSGVTLHLIERGIDTGDIIDQIVFDIPEDANGRDLYELYLDHGSELFRRNLQRILAKDYNVVEQAKLGSSYYSKKSIDFDNVVVDCNKTAYEIRNQVRAFAFRAYQLPIFNGSRISHAVIEDQKSDRFAGKVVDEDEFSFLISSVDFNVRLYKDRLDDILEACRGDRMDVLVHFHNRRYSFREKNPFGWDALIVAAYHENVDVCKWLLEIGCDPNTYNNNGTSALMYAMTAASSSSNLELLDLLIRAGADVRHRDFSGKSLIEYAKEYGNRRIVDFLSARI